MEPNFQRFEIYGILLDDICLKVLDNIKTTKKEEDENFYNDKILGNISYKIIEDLIEISFENINDKIKIYQKPIIFKNENSEEVLKAFNDNLLNDVLNSSLNYYDFYVQEKLKSKSDIISEKPSEVILKRKTFDNYDIFILFNSKSNLPTSKTITINTNKLIPQSIDTLNLERDKNIEVIVENRDQLIREINSFYDSKNKVLKILGCDGVGKSLTFIYLQSLIKNYKILYFNLKEFYTSRYLQKIEIFKKQLLMYFSEDDQNWKNKEIINKFKYNQYNELIKNIDEDILTRKEPVDIWILLKLLINKYKLNNVLYILDQFKAENDPKFELDNFEDLIIEKDSKSKLLVSYSINNTKVKNDFINILKGLLNPEQANHSNKEENEEKDMNNKIQEFFNSYEESKNYIDEKGDKNENEIFKNILEFKISDSSKIKSKSYPKIIKYETTKNKKEKLSIIYINKLISIKHLQNDKNINFIQKMEDFDYNPKYFYKWMNFYDLNNSVNPISIEEVYSEFLNFMYDRISKKIIQFYKSYCLKSQEEIFEKTIVKYLAILLDLIQKEEELTLDELIYILEYLPLKYIRINKVEDFNNKINNNLIVLSEDLNKFKFKFEFVFPFIEFVIRRYIYETGIIGNINFASLSPSGIGSILEIEVLKGFMADDSFIKCKHRTVWGFKSKTKTEKNISQKIDYYNFQKLILDDGNHPLDNFITTYYITPYNPNNEYLDSLLLIPSPFNDKYTKNYSLISTQMTIKKEKIYTLKEYFQATNIAGDAMKNIYHINITDKYFIFILAKEYDNSSTQRRLEIEGIPYIFYSTGDKFFYFDEKRKVKGIKELLMNEFKVESEKDQIQKQYLYNKNLRLSVLHHLLKRKRKLDNNEITKNLFSFARKKIFSDFSISDIGLVKRKIMLQINKLESFKNKPKVVEYVFQIPFSEINNINLYDNLLGVFAYSGELFLFYNNKNIIKLYPDEKANKENMINKIKLLIFDKSYIGLKEDIHDYLKSEKKVQSIENLISYNTFQPSDVFVYCTYNIENT